MTLTPLAASRWLGAVRGLKWFLIAALAALAIVAHGCHGDDDHELVAAGTTVAK